MTKSASIRCEKVVYPTYVIGQPDKNPMFLEKRVYQGSSGAIYPYRMIESVANEPVDQSHDAIILENEYLEVTVLPGLGGRIQRALDKTNGYDFIYHNRVIKPALVGLAGPWISGGIEFNWPQHHRPNTFGPVGSRAVKNPDGSCTAWCGETDRMYGTRGLHGVTIHPGKAVIEIHGRVFNPTALAQTFLWWANPAVSVHEDYQSIFPPDVTAVMDHGKRDVSTFPIATGTYYKVDYSPGTDISWYGNIPVPTSYMAYKSNFDFVGGYDHRRKAGLLHVADHHISPGKKQWTWGCGDFGRAWDRNLTDEDGPYFELMTGIYTDNQPDFAWLMPCEEKRFLQTFLPYKAIGHVRKATRHGALSLDMTEGRIIAGVYMTGQVEGTIVLKDRGTGRILVEERCSLSPGRPWLRELHGQNVTDREALHLSVHTPEGCLLEFSWAEVNQHPVPTPADPAPPPSKVKSVEELVHWGRHLEQYRHATRDPLDWYKEAVSREEGNLAANNALGKLLLRRGRPSMAAKILERAVARALERNPNPYEGESLHDLGICHFYLGNLVEAYDLLAKTSWNAAWKTPSALWMARIQCRWGNPTAAAELLGEALEISGRAHPLRQLYITVLRHLGQVERADAEMDRLLKDDPVNPLALNEARLLGLDRNDLPTFVDLYAADLHHYTLELLREYHLAGFDGDGKELISHLEQFGLEPGIMALYYVGNDQATTLPIDGVFPNRIEDILLLEKIVGDNPEDGKAWHLLGNALYDKRQHEDAMRCWERASMLMADFPTTHRNLGIAHFNKTGDPEKAAAHYRKALELDPDDARVFFEYDQLLKRCGATPKERLELLEGRRDLVEQRDDLVLEWVTLLNTLDKPDQALDILLSRKFHPWEGGEGKVTKQYLRSLASLAEKSLLDGDPGKALEVLAGADSYPENLSEGKLFGATDNDIHYLRGLAHEALGDAVEARKAWELATLGIDTPQSAWFYNDQPPELIFYQGLALARLGREDEARTRFEALCLYGTGHLGETPDIDFFAVSLPDFLVFEDDLERRNKVHCHLMIALGSLGLGKRGNAIDHLRMVVELDPSHQEAMIRLRRLKMEQSGG